MTYTTVAESQVTPRLLPEIRHRWGVPQYLAVIGIPVLLLEIFTVGRWIAAGPYQITQYRDGHTIDWYGARALESVMVLLSIWVVVRLVRECREKRKLFTFDVLFCLAGLSMIWASSMVNVFMPMFAFSSNWVNLNDMCGNLPGVVNTQCGRSPNPVLFVGLLETFGLLAIAMLLGAIATRIRRRWPSISNARLFGCILLGGMSIVLLEPIVIIPLHLWTYPGTPISLTIGGKAWRYPMFPEIFCFGFMLGIPAAVRFFRDDKGQTIVERSLAHYPRRIQTLVAGLALYTIAQFAVIGCATAPLWPLAFHQSQWPTLPASLNNGMCNQTGVVENTAYGPCPGSPGFRMPLSDSGSARSE